MVDMHVSKNQGSHCIQWKLDAQIIGFGTAAGRFNALEQAAIDQHAGVGAEMELVAGAGNAVGGTVVFDIGVIGHGEMNLLLHGSSKRLGVCINLLGKRSARALHSGMAVAQTVGESTLLNNELRHQTGICANHYSALLDRP